MADSKKTPKTDGGKHDGKDVVEFPAATAQKPAAKPAPETKSFAAWCEMDKLKPHLRAGIARRMDWTTDEPLTREQFAEGVRIFNTGY